jgi:hypothetical protein
MTGKTWDDPNYLETDPPLGQLEAPEADVAPQQHFDAGPAVAVRIERDDVDIRWHTNRFTVDGVDTVEIAGYQPGRRRALVRNSGPNTVYIGRQYNVDATFGYPVPSGAESELTHEQAMWAACAAGESADVAVLLEYEYRDG